MRPYLFLRTPFYDLFAVKAPEVTDVPSVAVYEKVPVITVVEIEVITTVPV